MYEMELGSKFFLARAIVKMRNFNQIFCLKAVIIVVLTAVNRFGESADQCGGALVATLESKSLNSPNFPTGYENNLNCVWTITPQVDGKQIEVVVEEIDTEACCDALDLKDGRSAEAQKIANLRGRSSGGKYATAYGGLQIIFTTDESVGGRGFHLTYKIVEASSSSFRALLASNISDIIVSPSWPLFYPSSSMYTWVIESEPNSRAGLTVLYLRTESCCDGLTIRNGNSETSPLLDDLRGEHTGLLYSSSQGGALSLRFYADSTNREWGFLLSYFSLMEDLLDDPLSMQAKSTECQENVINITEGYGMITPPGFPATYLSHLKCSWIIIVPDECKVRIWFSYVNTEECCDWIKIRDGKDHLSRKITLVSGNGSNFYNSVSSGSALRIEFDTDSKNDFRGFVAFYEVVSEGNSVASSCGGEIEIGSSLKYISSPGWPEPYNKTTECVWHVRTSPSKKIQLILLSFLTKSEYYNILVFDGPNSEGIALLDLNSDAYEPVVVSTKSSWLTISFYILKPEKVEYGGFRGAVIAVDKQ